jgi:hypothetical protein
MSRAGKKVTTKRSRLPGSTPLSRREPRAAGGSTRTSPPPLSHTDQQEADLPPPHPREFFDTYVKRSYELWSKAPRDLVLASGAVHQGNVMVERLVQWESRGEKISPTQLMKKAKNLREELAKAHPDFALVWDIDDAHKHLRLSKSEREVTSVAQTVLGLFGGAWGGSWGGSWGIATWGAVPTMIVLLRDGKRRRLAVILKNVIEMWDGRLPSSPTTGD